MKKILFAAVTLDVGGIETALVTLLNYLSEVRENDNFKYDITLVLEKKQGIFLDTIDKRINIIEYSPNNSSNIIFRKFNNFIKQIKFKNKYKNKFDFSASYATYSLPDSFVARVASKKSVLWCHMDYLEQFNNDSQQVKQFFEEKKYKEFSKLIFVSEQAKENFIKIFPEMKDKAVNINNLIDYKKIEKQAQENINEKDLENVNNQETIFLNVGRHDELQKRLSRIISVSKKLKEDNLNFKVWLIGDGIDKDKYKKDVSKYQLDDKIYFLGRKKNPYPYIKKCSCLILTSDYEGSPVVFTEALALNKPIITTKISGSEQIKDKFGLITEKNVSSIYENMKNFIKNGYVIKEKFDTEKYNIDIKNNLDKLIN